jgi:hypothetical protein
MPELSTIPAELTPVTADGISVMPRERCCASPLSVREQTRQADEHVRPKRVTSSLNSHL